MTRSGGAVRHGAAEAGEWQQERQRLQQEYLNKQVSPARMRCRLRLQASEQASCHACLQRSCMVCPCFCPPTYLPACLPVSRFLQGVDCGEVTLVVHVRPCEGLVRSVDGTIEKRFAKKEVAYPLEVGGGGWVGLVGGWSGGRVGGRAGGCMPPACAGSVPW